MTKTWCVLQQQMMLSINVRIVFWTALHTTYIIIVVVVIAMMIKYVVVFTLSVCIYMIYQSPAAQQLSALLLNCSLPVGTVLRRRTSLLLLLLDCIVPLGTYCLSLHPRFPARASVERQAKIHTACSYEHWRPWRSCLLKHSSWQNLQCVLQLQINFASANKDRHICGNEE